MFDNGMWEPLRDSREPEGYPTRARPQTGFASEAEQADSGVGTGEPADSNPTTVSPNAAGREQKESGTLGATKENERLDHSDSQSEGHRSAPTLASVGSRPSHQEGGRGRETSDLPSSPTETHSGTSDLQSGLPLENGAVSAPAPTPDADADADYLRTKLPELVQRMRDQQATPYDIWSRVEQLENAVAHLTTLVSMVVEIQTRKVGRAA